MKVKKLNSKYEATVNISKYRLVWDKPCRSKFQLAVKQWLKPYWAGHICLEEFRIPGSRLSSDIVNLTKRAVVEINGAQHDEYNSHFHRGSRTNWLSQIKRDEDKRQWASDNGFIFIEILPNDLPLTPEFFREKYNISLF